MSLPPAGRPPYKTKRLWPPLVAVAIAVAVITATVTVLITAHLDRTETADVHSTTSVITVTTTPPPLAPPAQLPTAQADRQTCNAWLAAGKKIHAASQAISVIPEGLTVLDQPVRDNVQWSAAVRDAADLYRQAGDVLSAGITPGTTAILDQAATTATSALRTLSTADTTLDPANGNVFDAWKKTREHAQRAVRPAGPAVSDLGGGIPTTT